MYVCVYACMYVMYVLYACHVCCVCYVCMTCLQVTAREAGEGVDPYVQWAPYHAAASSRGHAVGTLLRAVLALWMRIRGPFQAPHQEHHGDYQLQASASPAFVG